jgi:PadR family transcriptional regulator PadR
MPRGDWLTQARKGAVEHCVLALLDERERYGYEIVQELNSPGEVIIAEGSIYPLLKRLRTQGWVTSAWRESSSGPPRKYYSLTGTGRAHLASIAGQWKRFAGFVNRLLGGAEDDNSL